MQKAKVIKNSSILLAVLLCITALFSAGFGTSKVKAYSESEIQSLYETSTQMVAESGADPDGCFGLVYDTRIGADLEVVFNKLNLIVHIADTHMRIASDYSDLALEDLTFESRLHAKQKRDELLELLTVNKENFFGNELAFAEWASDYRATIEQMESELNELVWADDVRLVDYLNGIASKLYARYEELIKFTLENPSSNERQSSKFFIPVQQTELENLIAEYVVVNELDGVIKYVANRDGAFSYFASIPENSTEREHYDVADEIRREGIERLNKLPNNNIELAYAAYNDWLNADSDPTLSQSKKNAKLEEAKKAAKQAEFVYNNSSTSEEVLSTYSEIIKILKGFMSDPDTATESERVASCRDNRNVVKVTAIYSSSKKEVKVIPQTVSLKVYPSFNGSAARNATQKIKEGDKSLSVAYLIYIEFYTDYGRVYNLPERDKDGWPIEYRVEIDLNRYYQNYLQGQNYYTDEKTSITNAYERINKEGYDMQSSLCYSYASGEVEQLNYTFDGDNIVFYTKNFSNFCFAGIDTSTLFQNPLFWVLMVAVVILLIIVIKIIIKHTRYSVKFYSNGGSPVKRVRAAKNEYFVMPAPPVKQNFVFAGWYTDKALTNKFIGIQMRRRKSIKLYAKWSAPVTKDRLQEFYDILRKSMVGYQKVSFKPTLGLVEKEHLVSMFLRENNVEIYLAENPETLNKAGFSVSAHEDKKFSDLPCKVNVSSESTFAEALELIKKVFTDKGLQLRDESERANDKMTVLEDKENGFAYFITNERVANEPADFAELLRIAIKGYVLEEDNGNFKEGDVFTFARVYATEKEAQLYLPLAKDAKTSKARDARFEDTPHLINVMSASDLPEAYKSIDEVMVSYGFVKDPESSNDLKDVPVPEGHGFAYTLRF